jgi:hypothetical protein
MLNHVANIRSPRRIGEHRRFQIVCSELGADRQAKEIDHFVDVWPDEMGAQDSAGVRIDQRLKTVDDIGFLLDVGHETAGVISQGPAPIKCETRRRQRGCAPPYRIRSSWSIR